MWTSHWRLISGVLATVCRQLIQAESDLYWAHSQQKQIEIQKPVLPKLRALLTLRREFTEK